MLYVITAVHNRYKITKKFVDNLLCQTYKDLQLILVDDGSTDGTADMVRRKMPQAVILRGDGNLWWGGALQKAFRWIKANTTAAQNDAYVLFANDDTEFPADYIERGLDFLSEKPKTLLAGCGISRQTGEKKDGAIQMNLYTTVCKISEENIGNCASTRSLFFRVGDFKKIGGFHPKLLPHYGSDYEWTMRAVRKYGYTVLCDDSLQYQLDESTTGENYYEDMTRKSVFSIRSVSNPLYKFNFLFLAIPAKYLPKALWNQMKRYVDKMHLIAGILKNDEPNG